MSSKVYSIKYTGQDLPKSRDPIVISAGNLRSVAVPFMTEGYITRLVVKQTAGANVNCVIELLDSEVPDPPGEQVVATDPADDIELYRIIAQQTLTSGSALVVLNQEYGYPFHNQDGTFTDNQRFIYLVLKPQSAATSTTWEVAMTGHNEIG